MELHNISYNDPKVKRAIAQRCGEAYGLWASFRRGGTGSYRFELVQAPPHVQDRIDRVEDRRFCSLEVRSNGLLVRLKDRLETLGIPFGWADLDQVMLGGPSAGGLVSLMIIDIRGEQLVFGVRREHRAALDRMLERAIPVGQYRSTPSCSW